MKPRASALTLLIAGLLIMACSRGPYNEDQATSCNFLCKTVPARANVLKTFGKGAGSLSWDRDTLRVVFWNVYKGRRDDWLRDLTRLSSDADLVLLQELLLTPELQRQIEDHLLPDWSAAFAVQFITDDNIPTGQLTLSRVAPVWSSFSRTPEREPFVKSPKITLLTGYPLPGQNGSPDESTSPTRLRVANIHGLNFRREEGLLNQVRTVAQRLHVSAGSAEPAIFAGDFNSKDSSRIESVTVALRAEGFERVAFSGESADTERDQAFVRGLRVNAARVLTEISSSDHKPFYFEVALPSSAR